MKFKNNIILILSGLLIVSNLSLAGDLRGYVSYGLKFGYSFGESDGFIYGGEVSFNCFEYAEGYSVGICFSYDKCQSLTKYHFGGEVSFYTVGIEYGPTVIKREQEYSNSFSLTTYLGFLAIPYYSVTFNNDKPAIHEVGTYLKYPAQLFGDRYYGN